MARPHKLGEAIVFATWHPTTGYWSIHTTASDARNTFATEPGNYADWADAKADGWKIIPCRMTPRKGR